MSNPPTRSSEALNEVIDETRLLFHCLKRTAEILHRQGELSAGRRGVLKSLYESGPQTVPQLARARPVSRQHIRALVNPMVKEGYLELESNPKHKLSKLVCLTARGRALVTEMIERENRLLELIADDLEVDRLSTAARQMRNLREVLSRPSFARLLERLET